MYDRNFKQTKIIQGTSFLTICRTLLYILFSIILFSSPSYSKAKDHFVFSDSLYTYKIKAGSLKKTSLKRYIKTYPNKTKKIALFHLLDSLGYFAPSTDTITKDTIIIDVGNRSVVDTILVQSNYPFAIDSIRTLRFPILYDAGTIQSFARQALSFLAKRGFPFAKLFISISNKINTDTASDTANTGTTGNHLIVQFTIDTKKRAVFDSPLFFGEFKTKEKIIARDIVFRKGQLFDINKVETSQKRLESRYYIENIEVLSPGIVSDSEKTSSSQIAYEKNEADSIDTVAVPFVIKDKSGMGIDGAVGYNSDSKPPWSGLLTITMLNILHRGEAVSLFYRGEEQLQQFEVEILIPYPFMWPIFCSGAFGLEIEEKNYGVMQGEFKVLTQLKGLWQAGISVKGHETTTHDRDFSWYFVGVDLILRRQAEPYRAGTLSREFNLRTGTGVADRVNGKFSRWSFDFSAGSHIPLFKRQAFLGKVATKAITSDDRDSLHLTEKFRIGGYKNVRGYTENYYPFKAVAYLQTEYHYYFNPTGSVYIFIDGGAGFIEQLSLNADDRTDLLGYGLGIRVPVKFGTFSLEWARNYEERKGLGRIHVRFRNTLSTGMGL